MKITDQKHAHTKFDRTIRPEWTDPRGIQRMFGIGRSTLYRLIDEGKVKSTSLRERGKLRGKRLVFTDSVAALLESRATGGDTGATA
jgi:hypothetical protein